MTKFQRRTYILALFMVIVVSLTVVRRQLAAAAHVPFLNLDFEIAIRNLPFAWSVGGSGFNFALDDVDVHSGKRSLRIENVSAPANTLATTNQSFPVEFARGKRVRVSGWIKTANADGAAGIWWRVDGPNGTIS